MIQVCQIKTEGAQISSLFSVVSGKRFDRKGGFFVDLFVRVSNQVAVNMYKRLGYSVYRTVIEYYSASNGEPDEDAYDMRKALSRDKEKKSIIPLPHPVRPEDIE
ncbi:hypothetical protein Q5P01_000292 [Channa striata]|uniref:N-alpha-acetyltransferase 20 n=1 Tax=Channa striata TaxID=64152 RepID=A0AA88IFL9_CHASR|nr:hypothetical protein Q5P01_000292 [Channa striata]